MSPAGEGDSSIQATVARDQDSACSEAHLSPLLEAVTLF